MKRALRLLAGGLVAVLLPLAVGGADLPVTAAAVTLTAADALAAFYAGDAEGAMAAYRAVLERDPDNAAARADLVRLLRETGRFEEALAHLGLLLDRDPGQAALRLGAAETALLARQPERALGLLEPLPRSEESLYLTGMALLVQDRGPEAVAALAASLEVQPFHPTAWYWMGTLRYELGDLGGAEAALLRALAQEPNLTSATYPLAMTYAARGRREEAHGLLRRASAAVPEDPAISGLLASLEKEDPGLAATARQEQVARRAMAGARRVEALPKDPGALPVVRVGLAEGVRELHLKTGGAYTLYAGDLRGDAVVPVATGGPGDVLTLGLANGQVELSRDPAAAEGGPSPVRTPSPLTLVYDDPRDTTIVFDVESGRGSFWAGSEDRAYRGRIEASPRAAGLTLVNGVSLEEYLYSVVPSEMPASWPAAALEAQAVAARSYTMANLGSFASRGFDLLGDVRSAAYSGTANETASVRAAVDATRGMVLMEGDKPLSAFYSANSGGHTETTQSVWGFASPLPAAADPLLRGPTFPLRPDELTRWLRDRPTTYSSRPEYSSRSAYRWELWVPRQEIERRAAGKPGLGSVVAVTAGRRGVSGRVEEARIRGTAGSRTVRGDAIRWALGGLRSNLFTVEPVLGGDGLPAYFIFTGAGWGHGVGLCQSGAAGMAADGWEAARILRHYYGGAELRALY